MKSCKGQNAACKRNGNCVRWNSLTLTLKVLGAQRQTNPFKHVWEAKFNMTNKRELRKREQTYPITDTKQTFKKQKTCERRNSSISNKREPCETERSNLSSEGKRIIGTKQTFQRGIRGEFQLVKRTRVTEREETHLHIKSIRVSEAKPTYHWQQHR